MMLMEPVSKKNSFVLLNFFPLVLPDFFFIKALQIFVLIDLVFFNLLFVMANDSILLSYRKQDQINKIESQLSQEKSNLSVFNIQEKNILAQSTSLGREIKTKNSDIMEVKESITLANKEIRRLKKQLARSNEILIDAQNHMAKRLYVLYKYTKQGYLKTLANAKSPDQFLQRIKYLKEIIKEDQILLIPLADKIKKNKKNQVLISQQIMDKEVVNQKKELKLSALKTQLEEKVLCLINIHKEKEFYETSVSELQLAAKDLKKAMLKIEKKDTFLIEHNSFLNAKGKLPLPLRGFVISVGELLGNNTINLHKGIFLEVVHDRRVKAVFPGRVDFSGWLNGYGQVIIINHGSYYYTISAHLQKRNKSEGDLVAGGETIGLLEKDEKERAAHLYFEVRKDGKTLDPLQWLNMP